MAKEYSIKLDYLLKLKDMLASMGTSKTDTDVDRIQFVLDRISSDFTFNEDAQDTIVDTLEYDIEDLPNYRRFYPKVKAFHKDGAVVWSKPQDIVYQTIHVTNEDAYNLARGFFAQQGEFFLKHFDRITRDPENHISFLDPKVQTSGEMQYLETLDEAFMFIPDNHSIEKLNTLVHESQHCIDNTANPNMFDQDVIREASALFMELIAGDYYNGIFNLDHQNIVAQYDLFTSIKMHTNRLIDRTKMLMLYKKISHYDRNFIYRRLTKKWNPAYLERTKDKSLIAWYYYQISFMIAIELYELYKRDKRAALEHLKTIIMKGTDSNILTLLHNNGIVLNKHMYEYEKKLIHTYDRYYEERGD